MNNQDIRHIINPLPRCPAMPSTITKLQDQLLDRGYKIRQRTLQRDMNALEPIFAGIYCKKRSDRSVCWLNTQSYKFNSKNLKQ